MKKIFSLAVALFISTNIFAQIAVYDSVTMGNGYANQIFYSMQNGEVSNAPNNNWELAFTTYFMGANAWTNSAQGVALYLIPNTDTSGFSSVDTTGYLSWQMLNNSDTTWNIGAFNQNISGLYDYGWGAYSMTTNTVEGDSLFLVRFGMAPYTFKKFWLKKKDINGSWVFRYANLDNTGDVTDTILLTNYSGKNFSYYSLVNGTDLNREPATSSWDITFTRYTAKVLVAGCIPAPGFFAVTGVLNNEKVVSAQANQADFAMVNSAPYISQMDSNISTIGFDWICSGVLTDSVVYFIKANGGAIWKLQFTAPAPTMATGKIFFIKEQLNTGIQSVNENSTAVYVYPNPSDGNSTLVVDAKQSATATFNIYNVVGKLMAVQSATLKAGLNLIPLNTESLSDGIYFVKNDSEKNSTAIKLVITR